MTENEVKLSKSDAQKERIRQRYKGINPDELDVIPALPPQTLDRDGQEQRVAVYARVSTDDPRQTSSYELQKNHYQDLVDRHPGWRLVDIYADEGISGTSLKHRDSFIRMIEDCKAGKIDLIITKSVSRFARNVLDCIGYARELSAMHPPIGIFFETENIFTLNSNSEMSLSFISTLAQEESHTKSEIMNSSIEMRFKRGIFLTPPLLGYDQDEDGNLVINEDEAKTVRLIFFMYLYGYSTQKIAKQLTLLERPTKKGNTTWSPGSVLGILQNERHCGDVLARKTYTPNYLDHKSKKNRQDRNQYRKKDHHEAIVSRDDFIAVQRLISNAKYGNKGILPELSVISEGALRGYVSINPRWAGFKANDYRLASASIYDEIVKIPSDGLAVNSGDFDLRGFEIARGQFFDTANKLSMTLSSKHINFGTECTHKFSSEYVELLVHPTELMIAVRPASKENRNAVQWVRKHNGKLVPRQISGSAFLPNLYELFGWNPDRKYRLLGVKHQQDDDIVMLFSLSEVEILIPNSVMDDADEDVPPKPAFDDDIKPLGTRGSMLAYPKEWAHTFGNDYYEQAQGYPGFRENSDWNTMSPGQAFNSEPPLNVTSTEQVQAHIESMINGIQQEAGNEHGNQN